MEDIIDKNEIHLIMSQNKIRTQAELAKRFGMTEDQLSVLSSPKNNPIKRNDQKLCDLLGVESRNIMISKHSNVEKSLNGKTRLADDFTYVDTTKVVPNRQYKSIELFAGAGGLALGLEKAGFDAQGLVEIDQYAAQTLRDNRPKWNVIEDDIIKVSEKGIANYVPEDIKIDFVSGGYPCQAFSYAGHKLGLDDVRGTMFFYFAKVIKDLQPKIFLAENVRGLSSHDNGKTLQTMVNIFENLDYKVTWNIVRANDYGVAQKRERIAIVGIRNDFDIKYHLPKPYEYKPVLRDALKDVPDSIGEKYPEKKKKILELVPAGGYWRDLPVDIAKEYMGKSYYSGGGRTGMARRISWDEPSLTLTCSPAQKQTERCHPDETRPFTVREYARIQSFPDDWQFSGSMGQQYKQIGNAVPVEFAKAVGLSIINILNQIEERSS
ncbi:DNA cytosine methyltransferase [Lachnospiraceae bacterium ZAX-1]